MSTDNGVQARISSVSGAVLWRVLLLLVLASQACSDSMPSASEKTPAIPTVPPRKKADRIIVVAGDSQTVALGTQLPVKPVFAVVDAQGAPIGGEPVAFSTDAGSHLVGTATTTDSLGRVTATQWVFDAPGPHALTIKAGEISRTVTALTFGKVATVEVLAGAGQVSTSLLFPVAPRVRALDSIGTPVPGALAAFSVRGAGSNIVNYNITTGYARTDRLGVATVEGWHSEPVGAAILDVDVDGIKTTIRSIVPPTLPLTVKPLGSADLGVYPPGTELPIPFSARAVPRFEVRDAKGRLVSEVEVQFAAGPAGSSVVRWSAITDLGLVTPRWKLGDDAGAYQLTASVGTSNATITAAVVPFAPLPFADGISAGASHTCAALGSYEVYCWGSNRQGQVRRDGNVSRVLTPALVYTGTIGRNNISAVSDYTCVEEKPLSFPGPTTCWGQGPYVPLPAPPATPSNATSVFHGTSVGESHACGLNSDYIAYCWGRNDEGELGDGTVVSRSTPAPVLGGIMFWFVSAGARHTCGVTLNGVALCWGSNSSGQLGIGEAGGIRLVPTAVSGQTSFWTIAAGGGHTCATRLTPPRGAYCWGLNSDGQLGDGTTINRSVPTPVADYRP